MSLKFHVCVNQWACCHLIKLKKGSHTQIFIISECKHCKVMSCSFNCHDCFVTFPPKDTSKLAPSLVLLMQTLMDFVQRCLLCMLHMVLRALTHRRYSYKMSKSSSSNVSYNYVFKISSCKNYWELSYHPPFKVLSVVFAVVLWQHGAIEVLGICSVIHTLIFRAHTHTQDRYNPTGLYWALISLFFSTEVFVSNTALDPDLGCVCECAMRPYCCVRVHTVNTSRSLHVHI